uniref:Uncharacterized protein n=1 Tax=Rhizophora mucronata TaxID=61149 RepID=A0A2P2ILC0_RHIMU
MYNYRKGSESSISLELSCCVSGLRMPTKSSPSHCHGQHTYLGPFRPCESPRVSSSSSWWLSSSTLSLSLVALKSANLNDFSAASLAAIAAVAVSSLNLSFFSDSNKACLSSSSSCLSVDNCIKHISSNKI